MTSRRQQPRDPARAAALDVLAGTRVRDAYTNLLLPSVLARYGLTGRDAGLVTELAAGTLRMRGLYDAVLATRINRPLESLDADVLDVLRLGCHQLLSMRIPSHAAVSTSVELIRERMGPRPTGLVNAVLRKVAQRDLDGWVRDAAPRVEQDPHGHLCVAHSHPRWIVDELAQALDADTELPALLGADNRVGAATLVARPGRADVEELLAAGARRGSLSPYAVHLQTGNPGDVPAVREGRAGVQDEGSQVVALLAAAVPVGGRDQRWLDLCAGPGGKAALLGALAAGRGATLTANESQPHRAALVERAVAGLPAVTVVVADGRTPPWEPGSYDRVLLDAPCTGLGALRRRPESRWRRSAADLDDLVPLQRDLLRAALDSVRPGGVVVYATCSPVLRETTGVLEQVLAERTDVQVVDVRSIPGGLIPEDAVRGRYLQLWPHRHGTDAMFAAVLRRTG